MRRRQWANLACVSALALSLGWAAARAEGVATIDPTLGTPLPEQPALGLRDDETAAEKPAACGVVAPEAGPPART